MSRHTTSHQTAQDVQQGSTGDCYFLSALALATRDTQACRDLIDDSMEEHGIYGANLTRHPPYPPPAIRHIHHPPPAIAGVTFWYNGKWNMVYVDNCFPCYTSNDAHGAKPKPIYAKSTRWGHLVFLFPCYHRWLVSLPPSSLFDLHSLSALLRSLIRVESNPNAIKCASNLKH